MKLFSWRSAVLGVLSCWAAVSITSCSRVEGGGHDWPHQGSDLAPDAKVVWGALENGLRYAILPHDDPPDRVSLRLYVDAGSLMEEEDQRGVAHFLEHMAFNGTTNFPAGEMVEYFQRLGMAFGADTNAHTWYKETVYKLDLPRNDDRLMGESMQLLRDYADGILFQEEELERERGVILSEKLSRDSVDYRTYVAKLEFNLPDSLISRRLTIGTDEVISGAPRSRFLDFYKKYYTPDRMVVVVVGAVEPEAASELIGKYFGAMKAPSARVPDPDLGKLSPRGVVAHFHPEEEASASWIALETMREFEKGPDGVARRARELRSGLAHRILKRRLEILVKEENSPIIYGSASTSDMVDFVSMGRLQLAAKPENWTAALHVGEQELRRALKFGFTEAEMIEAKANVRQYYERLAETAATRKSRDLSNRIVQLLSEDRIFTDPADDLPRVSAELDKVTREECLEALREMWDGDNINVFVSGKIDLTDDEGKEAVLAAFHESRGLDVEPPVEEEMAAFAYGSNQIPGKIVSRESIDDLGITQVRFENGVRLSLKQTDFEKDTIRLTARIGGGKLTMPKDKPGLAVMLGQVFEAGGLEAHSADEIKRIFAGRNVAVKFSVEDDAFVLSGKTDPEDFLGQLQLMAAYLTAPGFRPEAGNQFHRNIESIYQELRHTPMGVMQDRVSEFLHGRDSRFGYPDEEVLLSRTLDEAKDWISPELKGAYLELTVLGDFGSEDEVIAMAAATFGALPPRAGEKADYAEARKIEFPEGPAESTFDFESDLPKSVIGVYWKSTDMWDIEKSRRMNLLASVMRDRMRVKIREELGDAYSPYARSSMSDVYTDYGYVMALVESDREKSGKIAEILRVISDDLKRDGVSEDELERAKKPILSMLEEYRRNNTYWMDSVMRSSQEYPQRLEWARTIVEDYSKATAEELSALAREYLGAEKALSVLVVPAEEESGEGSAEGSGQGS